MSVVSSARVDPDRRAGRRQPSSTRVLARGINSDPRRSRDRGLAMSTKQMVAGAAIVRPPRPDSPPPPPRQYGGQDVSTAFDSDSDQQGTIANVRTQKQSSAREFMDLTQCLAARGSSLVRQPVTTEATSNVHVELNRPRFYAHFLCWKDGAMSIRYDENTKARAVRLVREHRDDYDSEWAAMKAISGRLGMNPETLRKWVRQTEIDAGEAPGVSSEERRELRELRRKNRELESTIEILKAATSFFARECDPRHR